MATFGDRLRNRVLRWLFQGEIMSLDAEEKKAQGMIVLARRYYDGDQTVYLTTRQQAWLDLHPGKTKFVVNICATVVDAVVERLRVTGFDVSPGIDSPSNSDAAEEDLASILWGWWTANRMDAVQTEAHRMAVRDGESFVLVGWNNAEKRPDFVLHPRYVDRTLGGDGFGVWIDYENDDPFGKPERAIKQWTEVMEEQEGPTGRVTRQTHYYPDRIEKYVVLDGDWRPYQEAGDPEWPLAWTMPDGSPIGIPVAHLRNPGLRSELQDVVPLQDALNKAWLDIMAASDSTAFRMLVVLGFVPTTDGKEPAEDGSNLLQVAPGQMLATRRKPGDVSVEAIEPASLEPLLNVEERLVTRAAQISDTPLARFQFTRQVSSAESQKQQDMPIISKVQERQTLFGNAWEDLLQVARRQAAVFGGLPVDLAATISAVWMPAVIRDEAVEVQVATAKKALGVPAEQLWSELGYDAHQIDDMKQTAEVQARTANQQMAVTLAQQGALGG